jgi:hypothetical protein
LKIWQHCYIRFVKDDGSVETENVDGKLIPLTYGVLGDEGSRRNQIPRKGDPRNSKGKCKDAKGVNQCNIEKLKNGLDESVKNKSCPSCGENYRLWFARDLVHFFDGFNSNTYAHNMVLEAGMIPPRHRRALGYHPAPGPWYPPPSP